MSNYNDYIQDFPRRCKKLLERIEFFGLPDKDYDDLEVTALLSIASAALIIPMERLSTGVFGSGLDVERHQIAFSQLENFKKKLAKNTIEDWGIRLEDIGFSRERRMLDINYIAKGPMNIEFIGDFLLVARHALARGNIHVGGSGKIEIITFACFAKESTKEERKSPIYWYLSIRPDNFKLVIKGWIQFLETLSLPISDKNLVIPPTVPLGQEISILETAG